MQDPLVIVVPGIKVPAYPRHDAPRHRPIPLSDALEATWSDDRLFAPYQLPLETWPRYAKIGVDADACQVSFSATVFDVDHRDDAGAHAPLPDERWHEIRTLLRGHRFEPRYLYRTPRGVRLVYVHDPWSAAEEEGVRRALSAQFALEGLACDAACFDWSRMFYLPRVVRDGTPTRSEIVEGPVVDLSPAALPRDVDTHAAAAFIRVSSRAAPDPATAEALAWANGKPTKWCKKALSILPRDVLLLPLIEGRFEALPPPRTESLLSIVGCLVSRLFQHPDHPKQGVEGTTPEHIFGLLWPVLMKSDPFNRQRGGHGRPLPDECWRQITNMRARDEGKQAAREEEQAARAEEAANLQQRIADVMAGYPNPLRIRPADVPRQAVVSVGNSLYLLQSNGYYSATKLKPSYLYSELQRSGLEFVSLVSEEEGKAMKPQEILNTYHKALTEVRYTAGNGDAQAWTDGKVFYVCPYQRRKGITPRNVPEIQEFFRVLAGDDYERVAQWFGCSLAFDRAPLPALVIIGETDIGKSFVASGWAGCFENRRLGNEAIFGHFNYGPDTAAAYYIDEGWTTDDPAISTKLRRLITGATGATVNLKGEHHAAFDLYPRLYFSANSEEVLQTLLSDPKLTKEDIDAMRARLVVVDTRGKTKAAEYLAKIGREETGRWLREDLFAQQFFQWYREYGLEPLSGRFLMEGSVDPEILASVSFASGDVSAVGLAVLKLIAGKTDAKLRASDISDLWGGAVYTGSPAWRTDLPRIGRALSRFLDRERGRTGPDNRFAVNMEAVKAFAKTQGAGLNDAPAASVMQNRLALVSQG